MILTFLSPTRKASTSGSPKANSTSSIAGTLHGRTPLQHTESWPLTLSKAATPPSTRTSKSPRRAKNMKTAKELLQAYIDGSAQQAAALFASNGALELPYLADLGVEPRYEGPENIGAFLTFLHEKMYPGFKFIDVKI